MLPFRQKKAGSAVPVVAWRSLFLVSRGRGERRGKRRGREGGEKGEERRGLKNVTYDLKAGRGREE